MQTEKRSIRVSVRDQRLDVLAGEAVIASYPVSTSRLGVGFAEGSHQTPSGNFVIGEKIGDEAAPETIFRGRVPVSPNEHVSPNDDQILARILWLHGRDETNANTRERFIYIHGTNHEKAIGTPASHGCIRMKTRDVIALFDQVEVGARVVIEG